MAHKLDTPRILITGKDGQVGFALQQAMAGLGAITAVGRQECDMSSEAAIRALVAAVEPDIILNAAAYTAVDRAEVEPALAFAVNAMAPGVLAQEAAERNALLVHYSTDYVFSGDTPGWRSEQDPAAPRSVYGRSKFEGEEAIRRAGCRHFILRTSWVFGVHGGNFLKTILRLAQERDALRIVADQIGAPTSAALIAQVTADMVRQCLATGLPSMPATPSVFGTYHLAAAGETSWHGYAQFVVRTAVELGMSVKVQADDIAPIGTGEYPLPAARPANSRLSSAKLRANFGIHLPAWQDGVADVINQLMK